MLPMNAKQMKDESHLDRLHSNRCQFPSGALTGNLNVDHAMCILSLNIINDKIFLIEWFWFITLSVVSSVGAAFTLLTIACPSFRRVVIR